MFFSICNYFANRTQIVSSPDHPRYGQHLSAEEVNQLVKPEDETLDQVHEWLLNHGISANQIQYSPAKDWMKVTLPIKSVEYLLDTNYSIFKHEDGSHLVRTLEWSLPRHLHAHIDTIQPTNSFFRIQPEGSAVKLTTVNSDLSLSQIKSLSPSDSSNPTISQACNATAVTSLCLRKLYGKSRS
jgi:tripeptidyl-peptidase I